MALIAIRRQPIVVPASRGPALVPNSGMVDPRATAALAALADQTGQVGTALVDPNASAAPPLADQAAAQVALSAGQGGPARGGALIDQPRQPAPMEAPDDPGVPGLGQNGGFDVLKMLKGVGTAAGNSGGPAVQADQAASNPGLLDKIKNLFLGDRPPVDPAMVQTPDIRPDQQPPALDAGGPVMPVDDPSGGPTARPSIAADAAPGLARVAAAQSAPGALDAGPQQTIDPALASQDLGQNAPALTAGDAATPSLAGKVAAEPNFLDKLRGNPLALMLITGGLGTMAAASRRGATPLGAIGEGMSGGLRTAFETQAAEKERELQQQREALAEDREASEQTLRGKQGAFYDARTTAEPDRTAALTTRAGAAATNAAASETRAGAAVTNAAASTVRADAAKVRADAYAKGGGGNKASTAFEQKRQAWLAINPGDDQGALTYANGKAALSPSQKYLAARRLATSQLNGMISAPDNPEKFLDTTTNSILKTMDANDAKAGPRQGGAFGGGQSGNKGALGPATPHSQGDMDKLPHGALYTNPADGKIYRKK